MVKLLTLVFISITGLVVLGGHTSVKNPTANFSEPFKGTITPYGATTALYRIIFSYAGYENSFNVTNEIKVCQTRKGEYYAIDTDSALEPHQNDQEERIHRPAPCHCTVHLG